MQAAVSLLAATEGADGFDIGTILFHVFIVLVAAKVAAELAERVRVPAVLGEIVAGILIGPSVLNLVQADDALHLLGEIGVILLLLNVGLEMDVRELARVGRASVAVGVLGVAAPFLGGIGAGLALGQDAKTSVFLGAALTATSVGITARVFGDLGVLSSTESRIVLGAAVTDDVLGLIILTIVTRIVVDGSVSAASILGTTGLAVGFLLVTGVVGAKIVPPLLGAVSRFSKSSATLVAVAFAITMGFSSLADVARLAPIIGAFMAGLALNRSKQAKRIERELAPIGHVFIPVFFLSIGINTDITAIVRPAVLGTAAVLTVIAVAGKLVAAVGAFGTRSDKWMIGLGMIPRGEVGLIFATIGLSAGVLDADLYASLIVMVLVTTVMTPPLLRWKTTRALTAPSATVAHPATVAPEGGWFITRNGSVDLSAEPPVSELLPLALEAAALAADNRPTERLLEWFSLHRTQPVAWDSPSTQRFIALLRAGNPRSWRFLETLGILERAIPEVSAALRARRADPSELDPLRVLRFPTVDRLIELASGGSDDEFVSAWNGLERVDPLLLGALVLDLVDLSGDNNDVARSVLDQLSIPSDDERETAALVQDASLLLASLHDPDALDSLMIKQLAAHIGSEDRRRRLYLLSIASTDLDAFERAVLDELNDRVGSELAGRNGTDLCDARRDTAQRLAGNDPAAERIAHAPRSYILANEPEELVRQARLAEPPPRSGTARVAVTGSELARHWQIDVASRDQQGLLATITRVLSDAGMDILSASVATWGDGVVVDSFVVMSNARPTARDLSVAIETGLRQSVLPGAVAGASARFDNDALPWFTACTVEADDAPGVLAGITAAFALAGVEVHSARIATVRGAVVDRFSLTDADGRKLDEAAQERIRRALAGGSLRGRRGTR